MLDSPPARGAAVLALVFALCGLFVLAGTDSTGARSSPSTAALDANYEAHVGEPIETGASVVETDPTVVEIEYDAGVFDERTYRLRLEGAPPAGVGDEIYLYGELRPDRTVAVDRDRSVVRSPWEPRYMYGVSIVAAVFVVVALANGWRLRPRTLSLVPRERTLYGRWREGPDA
jgi:hypothetical protein